MGCVKVFVIADSYANLMATVCSQGLGFEILNIKAKSK